jgi:hypothetical protein
MKAFWSNFLAKSPVPGSDLAGLSGSFFVGQAGGLGFPSVGLPVLSGKRAGGVAGFDPGSAGLYGGSIAVQAGGFGFPSVGLPVLSGKRSGGVAVLTLFLPDCPAAASPVRLAIWVFRLSACRLCPASGQTVSYGTGP